MIRCSIFGHRRWYYDEDVTGDFVFGCVNCQDPALVEDRLVVTPVTGRPELVYVDLAFFERMKGRLSMR